MGRLTDKVAIITGGARGQGAAEAELFAREGAKVVIGDLLDEEGEKTAEAIGAAARYRHLDVTKEEDWAQLVTETVRDLGTIDVLVNNAAILKLKMLKDTTVEDFHALVNVNLLGTFLGLKAVLPTMCKAQRGSVVNVSSIDGQAGMPAAAVYSATKYAVRGLTRSVALEVARKGVRVNALCPGMVETPMTKPGEAAWSGEWIQKTIPLARTGSPEEMAQAALWLASDESRYCTGTDLLVDGGVLAGSKLSSWM